MTKGSAQRLSGMKVGESPACTADGDEEGRKEAVYNNADQIIHRLASRISENTVVMEVDESYNDIFHPLRGSKLDPQCSSFDTRAWVEALVQYESVNSESGRRRRSGVSFRNLDVYGFGKYTDYQKTVGNSILSVITPRRKHRIDILHDLEGIVNTGEMLLVLGPPGSGCSTFLKAISGHMKGLFLGDKVRMNYRGVSSNEMHNRFRGEAIFAAHARAPRELPCALKVKEYSMLLRDVIMATFGISHTMNTVVGNDFIRGVSGGERKRVSIAEAALSDAALQCWDNSTRGLDSANAVEFCRTLRTATELLQSSVLVSLYQAPQEAYDIYFGPTSGARAYFEELGFECPEQQTTPDFLTSMTSPKERRVRPGFEYKVPVTAMEFEARWKESKQRQQLVGRIEAYNNKYSLGGESRDEFVASHDTNLDQILTLYEQRPVVEKHKQFALYHPSAEALASMMIDIPYKLLNTLFFNLTLYLMANLRRDVGAVFFFLFIAFLSTMVTSSLFRTIASVSRTMSQAMVPAALLVLGLIMYTGFTMPTMYMRGWSRWITYVNPLSYAFESLIINEFHNREFSCSVIVPSGPDYNAVGINNRACAEVGNTIGTTTIQGDIYINDKFGYHQSNKWRNVGIMVAFWVIFTTAYLVATEVLSMARSRGEVLIFRRGLLDKKKSTLRMANVDEEAVRPPTVTMVQLDDIRKTNALQGKGHIFHWQDVCYEIRSNKEVQRILDHVDGWIQPGTLTALMGVSGAGKTTLLNVLAKRVTTGVVTGDMLINGAPNDTSFQRKTGYVQQQDVHLSTCSVRESLEFSALLRQPASLPRAEKLAHVEEVIRLLDMQEYADAIVGVPGEGLNIEQRRRLTIGIELAAKPELLLFLDEPTSGLDSQTSWTICQLLKRLARTGQAILCTIHQPSAILFQQFDNLLLLAKGGKTVYFGEIGHNSATLIHYLKTNGRKQCSPGANPAEWMLEVIGAAPGSDTIVDWPKVWKDSSEYKAVRERLHELRALGNTIGITRDMRPSRKPNNRDYASSFLQQWWLVQKRVAAQYWRNPSYIYSKVSLTVGSTLFIGFSFYNAPNTIQGLQNQMYAVMMLLSMFGQLSEQIMPQFIEQRDVYEARERPSRMYEWKVLMLSNLVIEIVWNSLMAVVAYFCWYYPIGLYQNAIATHQIASRGCLMFLFTWAFMMFTSTFTHTLIAGMDSADSAGSVGNLCYMLCITFCGILVKKTSLPGFWTFMYYVSPFTWLASGLLSTGVANAEIECAPNEYVKFLPPSGQSCGSYMASYISSSGGYLIDPRNTEGFNIRFEGRWRNFGIVLAYIVFNVMAAFAMYKLFRVPKRRRR
ncbi:uncharacterized protein An06g02550 [Aspergillus niger]|uniref:Contig An06c0110, genomic contig n=2 Tax=Aspergillus niger TaxID=5061 RepID=A2QLV3_ASPNC|nr:uncharacterized protein An06g02550 [Aspergillus niger]CAK39222.1 unnamed protein product [Aspergillus niger]